MKMMMMKSRPHEDGRKNFAINFACAKVGKSECVGGG